MGTKTKIGIGIAAVAVIVLALGTKGGLFKGTFDPVPAPATPVVTVQPNLAFSPPTIPGTISGARVGSFTIKLNPDSPEDVEVRSVSLRLGQSAANMLNNVVLKDVTGREVSPRLALVATTLEVQEFSLDGVFLARGEEKIIDVFADVHGSVCLAPSTGSFQIIPQNIVKMRGMMTAAEFQSESSAPFSVLPITVSCSGTLPLSATKNSSLADKDIAPGGTEAFIGSMVLRAGSAEGVTVNTVTLRNSGGVDLTNLKLKDHSGTLVGGRPPQFGATRSVFNRGDTAVFTPSSGVTVSANSTRIIGVYAAIPTSCSEGSVVSTAIPASGVLGFGAVTANAVSAPGTEVALQNMRCALPSFEVGKNAAFAGGAITPVIQKIASFQITPSALEDIRIREMKLKKTGSMNFSNLRLVLEQSGREFNLGSKGAFSADNSVTFTWATGLLLRRGATFTYHLYGKVVGTCGPAVSTDSFFIPANGVSGFGATSAYALTKPASDLPLQTVTCG